MVGSKVRLVGALNGTESELEGLSEAVPGFVPHSDVPGKYGTRENQVSQSQQRNRQSSQDAPS
jgi:hypothetical protein